MDGEKVVSVFQTIRDQVVYNTKRVITINIQEITGVRKSIFSYPYSKIQYYGIETAGLLDVDRGLIIGFADGIRLVLDFTFKVNIKKMFINI